MIIFGYIGVGLFLLGWGPSIIDTIRSKHSDLPLTFVASIMAAGIFLAVYGAIEPQYVCLALGIVWIVIGVLHLFYRAFPKSFL